MEFRRSRVADRDRRDQPRGEANEKTAWLGGVGHLYLNPCRSGAGKSITGSHFMAELTLISLLDSLNSTSMSTVPNGKIYMAITTNFI